MFPKSKRHATKNLAMIAFVAEKLGSLNEEVVFLGGAATALLITDHATPDVRPTIDVDCLGCRRLRPIIFKQEIL